jgi:hypothetical protein
MRIPNPSCLIVAALLTGCSVPDVTFTKLGGDAATGSGGDGPGPGGGGGGGPPRDVLVRWSLRHLAPPGQIGCPQASDLARVTSVAYDPATQEGSTTKFTDTFNCTDGSGLITIPDNFYLILVSILTPAEVLLANSSLEIVDTTVGDDVADATFFDDAGHLSLIWDVQNKATQARVSCASAMLSGADTVEMVTTNIADPSKPFIDRYFCEDHFGTSQPLLPGHYTVSVNAIRGGAAVGDPVTVADVQVFASNVTDVGNVKLKVPVP